MKEKKLINKTKKFVKKLNEKTIVFNNLLYNEFLPEGMYEEYKELVENFKTFYKDSSAEFFLWRVIGDNLKIDKNKIKKYYLWDIAVNEKENLVSEEYPLLNKTKDNLVEVKYGTDINKNGFEYEKHYLIFESELSINFHLMGWIIANWKGDSKFYVAIDKDKLGEPETIREVMLLSHWEGPKTVKNISESFNKNELIIKGPFNAGIPLYDKVEFLFRDINGKWHLEIEELLPRRGISFDLETYVKGEKAKYFTRYIHAITDKEVKKCFHLDGAIRSYDNFKNFKDRNLSDIGKKDWSKKSKRYKLFRFDSENGINNFEKIIGLFFLWNPYVREFFEGETEELKEMEEQREKLFEFNFKYKRLG